MKKSSTLTIWVLVMNLVIGIFVNACNAEGLTIGDENVWIVVTASGTAGKVSAPIIITDPKGRRMGYDPRTDKWLIEFDAGYDRMNGLWGRCERTLGTLCPECHFD